METSEFDAGQEVRPDVVRHFSQMAYFSFELSQGSEPLQDNLLLYAKTVNSELRLSKGEVREINRGLTDLVLNRLKLDWEHGANTDITHPGVEESNIGQSIHRVVGEIKEIFSQQNEASTKSRDDLEEEILMQIIERDYKFLVIKGGRSRGQGAEARERYSATLSQLRYFVGENHQIPVPEFNEMFANLHARFKEKLRTGVVVVNDNQSLREVDRKYYPSHMDIAVSVLAKTWETVHEGKFLEPFGEYAAQ